MKTILMLAILTVSMISHAGSLADSFTGEFKTKGCGALANAETVVIKNIDQSLMVLGYNENNFLTSFFEFNPNPIEQTESGDESFVQTNIFSIHKVTFKNFKPYSDETLARSATGNRVRYKATISNDQVVQSIECVFYRK